MLERPRFDVWVPRSYGALHRALAPMPRIAREGVLKVLGAERGAAGATPEARAAYEARTASLADGGNRR